MQNKIVDKQKIFDLIEQITPNNNLYRDLVKHGVESGTRVLVIMWKVGEIIENFIKKHDIKAHNLYWQIYGKAEGLKTSYITRDFLSYCLRIRKYFQKIEDITNIFPQLQRYSLFREAFPLLENPKYKLSKVEANDLIKILNSANQPQKIKEMILEIKNQRIGIKNTRNQKLNEMKPITDNFVVIHNDLYTLIKNNEPIKLDSFTTTFQRDYLMKLSQKVAALSQENLYIPILPDRKDLPDQWIKFINNLNYLLTTTVETRNRFRRLIPPRRLFELADMILAITNDRGIINYRKRKHII